MTDESFRRFRCWRTAEVQRTVLGDIGALGSRDDDAVFLAAHAPVPLNRGPGTDRLSGGEREILDSLVGEIGKARQNTLIAVTGDAGTGKSHAVRWVRAHLEDDPSRYHTLYIPRDLSTLRGLLGWILDGLPGDKAEQAKRQLDRAIGAKPDAQLRDELIFNLRQVLAFELPDQGPGDVSEEDREERTFLLGQREDRSDPRKNGLADILLVPKVMEHLGRDDGTVADIIGSVKSERPGRDARYPRFTEDDIPREAGIYNQLEPAVRAVWNSLRSAPGPAVALLNEALQRAVSMTIGFGIAGGVTLNDVFNQTRRLLRQRGIELVLLFEDLAQFGLVDADLYDQFTQQPADEYCPLRVVFAATDGTFRKLPETVRSRSNHRFYVQNLAKADEDSRSDMVTFTARYLNNARVGRDRLVAARASASDRAREDGSWVPNGCTGCLHQQTCFEAFGHADLGAGGVVGLYPHNEESLRRAFLRLREQNTLDPRHVVNEVVRSFLNMADPAIDAGIFPPEDIGTWFQMSVNRGRDAIVATVKAESPEELDRLRRARIAWRDCEPENRGMHVAFDLPGDLNIEESREKNGERPPVAAETPAPPPAPSRERELLDNRARRMQSLYEWDGGNRELPDKEMTEFRNILRDWTLAKMDLGRYLINTGKGKTESILTGIFSPRTFFIDYAPGARPAEDKLCFEVRRSPHDGLRLLTAVRWFNDHGHWDPAHPGRLWEFPADVTPCELQVALENFLGSCARAVEERFLRDITSSTGTRPAAAVVSLRTASLRLLGGLDAQGLARVVDVVGAVPDHTLPGSWSPAWGEIAARAQEVMGTLDPSFIGEFASAHQGTSQTPIVVDAAALEAAGRAAFDDPAAAIDQLGEFSDKLSEISLALVMLTVDWDQVTTAERSALLDELRFLRESTAASDRDLAAWADELGKRANASGVFRPAEGLGKFREAVVSMRTVLRSEVDEWLEAAESIGDPGNPAALFDAQRWSSSMRSYADAVRLVLQAMNATARELSTRIRTQAGGDPQAMANTVAKRFDAAASLLDRLGGETS